MKSKKEKLTAQQCAELLSVLKARFEKNMARHKGLKWSDVEKRLQGNSEKLSLIHI